MTTPAALIANTKVGRLNISDVRLLAALATHPFGSALSTDLQKALGMSPAAFSKTVERMVEKGLATREDAEPDRRRRLVTVTDSGLATVENFGTALLNATRSLRRRARSSSLFG
jgi:DNA-binding MarR family transcriptional regulator